VVEVFLLTLGSVPVDVSFWVFIIRSHIELDFSLKVTIRGNTVSSVSSVSLDGIAWNPVWGKHSSEKSTRVLPTLASIRVNLVVDGDIGFTEVGLLVSGPETRFSGRSEITWVFGRVLLFLALLVWPDVLFSFFLLGLRSVSLTDNLDSVSGSWAGSFFGGLIVLGPENVDGTFVSWFVFSFVPEEVGDLVGRSGDVDANDSSPSFVFILGSELGLNFSLLNSCLGDGKGEVKGLGLGNGSGVLSVPGGLEHDLRSKFVLGVFLKLDLGLSFNLVKDGLGILVLFVPNLQSTSLSGWGKEESLEHVSESKTDQSDRTSKTASEVLVFRSEEFPELTENVDPGVDLFTVEVLSTSVNSFHELVFVARSQFTFFPELFSLTDDGVTLAGWACLFKEIPNFLFLEGGWDVGGNCGDGSSVDLGKDGILFSWSMTNKVDRLLFHIESEAELARNTDPQGPVGLD